MLAIQLPADFAFRFRLRAVCQLATPNIAAAADPITIPAISPLVKPPFISLYLLCLPGGTHHDPAGF